MTISLRNLPINIETAIVEISNREKISLNKATIRLLETTLHKPTQNHDFEKFAGSWSAAEADEFDALLCEMR